jgi:hypothetical protein
MARQPMPKALTPLQSDQRSYTSEFSVVSRSSWRELVSEELLESSWRELVFEEL